METIKRWTRGLHNVHLTFPSDVAITVLFMFQLVRVFRICSLKGFFVAMEMYALLAGIQKLIEKKATLFKDIRIIMKRIKKLNQSFKNIKSWIERKETNSEGRENIADIEFDYLKIQFEKLILAIRMLRYENKRLEENLNENESLTKCRIKENQIEEEEILCNTAAQLKVLEACVTALPVTDWQPDSVIEAAAPMLEQIQRLLLSISKETDQLTSKYFEAHQDTRRMRVTFMSSVQRLDTSVKGILATLRYHRTINDDSFLLTLDSMFAKADEMTHRATIRLECRADMFGSTLNCCETIREILTLCEQDVPYIPVLDQELRGLVFAKSVQVYTTEKFRHHFANGSNERNRNIFVQDIAYTIRQTNEFALVVVDTSLQPTIIELLKDADNRLAGVLLVGNILNSPDLPKIRFVQTQPNELMKNANCLLEMSAFSLLKSIRLTLQQYGGNSMGSGIKTVELLDLIDLIVSTYERSFNLSSSNKD